MIPKMGKGINMLDPEGRCGGEVPEYLLPESRVLGTEIG